LLGHASPQDFSRAWKADAGEDVTQDVTPGGGATPGGGVPPGGDVPRVSGLLDGAVFTTRHLYKNQVPDPAPRTVDGEKDSYSYS